MQEFPGARLAGQGTTGFVFVAELSGMMRALKLRYDKVDLSTTASRLDALTSEVDVLNSLDHPNIVRTHGEIRGPLPMNLVSLLPQENQVTYHTHTRGHHTCYTYNYAEWHVHVLDITCRLGSRERQDGRGRRRVRPYWCWITTNVHYSRVLMTCATTSLH